MDLIFVVLALVRWVHFAAMFGLFGCAVFWAYAPRDGSEDAPSTRRVAAICRGIAAPLALVSGVAWLVATIVNMTGGLDGLADPDTLHAFFFETMFGPIEAARMGLLLVACLLAFAPMGERRRDAAIAVVSGMLLVSQAWLGHAAEGGDSWRGATMIACYGIHLLAAAAWLGGLPLLLARIVELRRDTFGSARRPILRLLSRYSLVATIFVVAVVASGIANAGFRVAGRFGVLWPTTYGSVLLVKVALVALMLGFAAYNRLVAMPRLADAANGGRLVARLATSVGCEIALGLLVLAAAAVLGITPPPAG